MDEDIRSYYETGVELGRVEQGYSRIEFARTKELLARYLPAAPATVLDVGGGPGVYADWLTEAGYQVTLVDATPLHVEQAVERAAGRFTAVHGDARALEQPDDSFDAVLLLGPLYHLTEREDRLTALGEAGRVLRRGGVLAVAAISRFASLLDGLYAGYLSDPEFRQVVDRDLADGQHRSPRREEHVFTTAFFHLPEELRAELEEAGFAVDGVFGVEGPGWLLPHAWEDEPTRQNVLRVARVLEQEATAIGVSPHLFAVGRTP